MKKVLFVISTLDCGGAQRAVSNIVTHLPQDYEIDILLNSDENIQYPYRGNVISLNIKIAEDRDKLSYQLKVFLKRFYTLRSLKRKNNYDACISFLHSANVVNIFTKTVKCKTIISVRSSNMGANKKGLKFRLLEKPLIQALYNKADITVSLSKGVEYDLYKKLNITNVKTIYNGFDCNEIKKKAASKAKAEEIFVLSDRWVIATAGRLEYPKGHWHLLKCVKYLKEYYQNILLVIMGEGSYRQDYEKFIEENNLQEHILLKGFVENPFAIYRECKLFIFPSQYEGFGNALLEAMACGLPCIATDFRFGAREILAPGTPYTDEVKNNAEFAKYGVIVPVCSERYNLWDIGLDKTEQILAASIERMINDTELRTHYKEQSFFRAKQFDINETVLQWREII